jgi:hypothetical protein
MIVRITIDDVGHNGSKEVKDLAFESKIQRFPELKSQREFDAVDLRSTLLSNPSRFIGELRKRVSKSLTVIRRAEPSDNPGWDNTQECM